MRQREDPAIPRIVRLPQCSEADTESQDDAEQTGDSEPNPPHSSILEQSDKFVSVMLSVSRVQANRLPPGTVTRNWPMNLGGILDDHGAGVQ